MSVHRKCPAFRVCFVKTFLAFLALEKSIGEQTFLASIAKIVTLQRDKGILSMMTE